jgi:FKBP-type peptidyl-prolyl cis-trans isomerase (trigger factor)
VSNSERDIRVNLALLEVSKRENITETDEDTSAEVERLAEERKVPKASMRAYLDRTGEMSTISSRLLRRKVLDFLTHASNIKSVASKGVSD